ncbi:hypothetical protein EDC96DRAFT_523993, partial [Choanephora cucurbitarum]
MDLTTQPPTYYTPGIPTLPPGWVEYRTPTGQPYWYNTATHLSSWVFPLHPNLTLNQPKKKQIKKKIPNTHWLFVLTPDGYEFYYDRDTKTSVWEMPPELKEPMEELKQLEQAEEEEEKKKREEQKKLEEEKERETKRIKLEEEQQAATEMTEDDIMWQLQQMGEQDEDDMVYIEPEQEPLQQTEEEVKEVKEEEAKKTTLSEEECIAQFNQLLEERNISPFAVYSVEYPQLMTDPRFSLVSQQKQKALFNKYCNALGERLKHQNKAKKKPEEEFRELLESKVTEKMYWDDFRRKYKNDPRFKAISATREKEAMFKDYVRHELGKPKTGKEAYMDLLRSTKEIKVGIRWRDAKKILEKDDRFYAIESKTEREDVFRDYLDEI